MAVAAYEGVDWLLSPRDDEDQPAEGAEGGREGVVDEVGGGGGGGWADADADADPDEVARDPPRGVPAKLARGAAAVLSVAVSPDGSQITPPGTGPVTALAFADGGDERGEEGHEGGTSVVLLVARGANLEAYAVPA